ncbi:hypothetical protein P5V15_011394 [Pogonomyrmex californicus]
MLDTRINAEKFLTKISNVSLDANYLLFTCFSCECSDTILGVLYQLGYFGTDARLLRIVEEIIESRRAAGHEEEDVGGHIQNLLSHLHNEGNARQRITALVYSFTQIRRRRAEEEPEAGPARRARVELMQEEAPPEIIQLSYEANIKEPQRGGNRILFAQENLEEEEEEEQEHETADEEREEEEVREEQVVEETEEEEEEREQARVAQSAGGLDIAQNFNVRVFNVTASRGRGRVSNKLTPKDVAKRSILTISNSDNLCFPRSLIAAQIYHERGMLRAGELHERWNAVRRQNSSIREIECFQRFFAASDIASVVYNFATFGGGERSLFERSRGIRLSKTRALTPIKYYILRTSTSL